MGNFPNKSTQFQPGNKFGKGFPKGGKHISTWIQELMNDEEFEANVIDSVHGIVRYKGAPVKAIILTARERAVQGDIKWADWLAKYGYGTKQTIEIRKSPAREVLEAAGLVEGEENDVDKDTLPS